LIFAENLGGHVIGFGKNEHAIAHAAGEDKVAVGTDGVVVEQEVSVEES
jgi:hypothetical protein